MELARRVQRGPRAGEREDRSTAVQWLTNIRCFFADVCTWGAEEGSLFEQHAPAAVPLERHDLKNIGFEKVRRRALAQSAEKVIDLEREIPKMRALAIRRWDDAEQALNAAPPTRASGIAETEAFWDWAVLELLLQSGLRMEASELITLDVLRRRHPDGRTYYMLHVKPSKFDRARVIPIGHGLGRVIAEIIRHVRAFYGTDRVPDCDHYDASEKRALPRAPYLLQGCRHPSPVAFAAIRTRLARLSRLAELRRADGSERVVRPHDCRRAFASEHLNNNTPVHVIQALLGHASIDTVMVYAKLYHPSTLVEEYRKTVRAVYVDHHGTAALHNPTAEEWAEFQASCGMRDMGTHLCALPTGEHCARGLVCLGCGHAQPKQSAAPVFRRMLSSHRRSLTAAREGGEPAGQIAARELEVIRIESALRRAEELTEHVAGAIEAAG
jgi:integrase